MKKGKRKIHFSTKAFDSVSTKVIRMLSAVKSRSKISSETGSWMYSDFFAIGEISVSILWQRKVKIKDFFRNDCIPVSCYREISTNFIFGKSFSSKSRLDPIQCKSQQISYWTWIKFFFEEYTNATTIRFNPRVTWYQ